MDGVTVQSCTAVQACTIIARFLFSSGILSPGTLCGRLTRVQPYNQIATALLVLWVFACTYIRVIPTYTYAANVASFSAAMIIFASRYLPVRAYRSPRGW